MKRVLQGLAILLMIAGVFVIVRGGWNIISAPTTGDVAVNVSPDPATPTSPIVEPSPSAITSSPQPTTSIENGKKFATLIIRKIGLVLPIREGIDDKVLDKGLGHYPKSALPGELGNFAIAGHRIQGVLWDVDKLNAGDIIEVKYGNKIYVYKVYKRYVVDPYQVDVVNPNPGTNLPPDNSIITLTTCLKSGNHAREIVHAYLSEIKEV